MKKKIFDFSAAYIHCRARRGIQILRSRAATKSTPI